MPHTARGGNRKRGSRGTGNVSTGQFKMSSLGIPIIVSDSLDMRWKGLDMQRGIIQHSAYGVVFLDEYGLPIDGQRDVEILHAEYENDTDAIGTVSPTYSDVNGDEYDGDKAAWALYNAYRDEFDGIEDVYHRADYLTSLYEFDGGMDAVDAWFLTDDEKYVKMNKALIPDIKYFKFEEPMYKAV